MAILPGTPEYVYAHGAAYIRTDVAAERMNQSWINGATCAFVGAILPVTHAPPTEPVHAADAHDFPLFASAGVGDLRP